MANPTKNRPLSPHLFIYRPIPTMVMSILHRMTGGALYFGTLLVAVWLIGLISGEHGFSIVQGMFNSWIGRLILFGYTWALMQHLLGGLKHFMWDLGYGLEKDSATRMAKATIAVSSVLTILIWVAAGLMT